MNNHKLEIYIPSNIRGKADPAAHRAHVKIVSNKLTQLFGGCTAMAGTGFYKTDADETITENVTIIHVFVTEEDLQRAIRELTYQCEMIKMFMLQESVLMTIDNKAVFC